MSNRIVRLDEFQGIKQQLKYDFPIEQQKNMGINFDTMKDEELWNFAQKIYDEELQMYKFEPYHTSHALGNVFSIEDDATLDELLTKPRIEEMFTYVENPVHVWDNFNQNFPDLFSQIGFMSTYANEGPEEASEVKELIENSMTMLGIPGTNWEDVTDFSAENLTRIFSGITKTEDGEIQYPKHPDYNDYGQSNGLTDPRAYGMDDKAYKIAGELYIRAFKKNKFPSLFEGKYDAGSSKNTGLLGITEPDLSGLTEEKRQEWHKYFGPVGASFIKGIADAREFLGADTKGIYTGATTTRNVTKLMTTNPLETLIHPNFENKLMKETLGFEGTNFTDFIRHAINNSTGAMVEQTAFGRIGQGQYEYRDPEFEDWMDDHILPQIGSAIVGLADPTSALSFHYSFKAGGYIGGKGTKAILSAKNLQVSQLVAKKFKLPNRYRAIDDYLSKKLPKTSFGGKVKSWIHKNVTSEEALVNIGGNVGAFNVHSFVNGILESRFKQVFGGNGELTNEFGFGTGTIDFKKALYDGVDHMGRQTALGVILGITGNVFAKYNQMASTLSGAKGHLARLGTSIGGTVSQATTMTAFDVWTHGDMFYLRDSDGNPIKDKDGDFQYDKAEIAKSIVHTAGFLKAISGVHKGGHWVGGKVGVGKVKSIFEGVKIEGANYKNTTIIEVKEKLKDEIEFLQKNIETEIERNKDNALNNIKGLTDEETFKVVKESVNEEFEDTSKGSVILEGLKSNLKGLEYVESLLNKLTGKKEGTLDFSKLSNEEIVDLYHESIGLVDEFYGYKLNQLGTDVGRAQVRKQIERKLGREVSDAEFNRILIAEKATIDKWYKIKEEIVDSMNSSEPGSSTPENNKLDPNNPLSSGKKEQYIMVEIDKATGAYKKIPWYNEKGEATYTTDFFNKTEGDLQVSKLGIEGRGYMKISDFVNQGGTAPNVVINRKKTSLISNVLSGENTGYDSHGRVVFEPSSEKRSSSEIIDDKLSGENTRKYRAIQNGWEKGNLVVKEGTDGKELNDFWVKILNGEKEPNTKDDGVNLYDTEGNSKIEYITKDHDKAVILDFLLSQDRYKKESDPKKRNRYIMSSLQIINDLFRVSKRNGKNTLLELDPQEIVNWYNDIIERKKDTEGIHKGPSTDEYTLAGKLSRMMEGQYNWSPLAGALKSGNILAKLNSDYRVQYEAETKAVKSALQYIHKERDVTLNVSNFINKLRTSTKDTKGEDLKPLQILKNKRTALALEIALETGIRPEELNYLTSVHIVFKGKINGEEVYQLDILEDHKVNIRKKGDISQQTKEEYEFDVKGMAKGLSHRRMRYIPKHLVDKILSLEKEFKLKRGELIFGKNASAKINSALKKEGIDITYGYLREVVEEVIRKSTTDGEIVPLTAGEQWRMQYLLGRAPKEGGTGVSALYAEGKDKPESQKELHDKYMDIYKAVKQQWFKDIQREESKPIENIEENIEGGEIKKGSDYTEKELTSDVATITKEKIKAGEYGKIKEPKKDLQDIDYMESRDSNKKNLNKYSEKEIQEKSNQIKKSIQSLTNKELLGEILDKDKNRDFALAIEKEFKEIDKKYKEEDKREKEKIKFLEGLLEKLDIPTDKVNDLVQHIFLGKETMGYAVDHRGTKEEVSVQASNEYRKRIVETILKENASGEDKGLLKLATETSPLDFFPKLVPYVAEESVAKNKRKSDFFDFVSERGKIIPKEDMVIGDAITFKDWAKAIKSDLALGGNLMKKIFDEIKDMPMGLSIKIFTPQQIKEELEKGKKFGDILEENEPVRILKSGDIPSGSPKEQLENIHAMSNVALSPSALKKYVQVLVNRFREIKQTSGMDDAKLYDYVFEVANEAGVLNPANFKLSTKTSPGDLLLVGQFLVKYPGAPQAIASRRKKFAMIKNITAELAAGGKSLRDIEGKGGFLDTNFGIVNLGQGSLNELKNVYNFYKSNQIGDGSAGAAYGQQLDTAIRLLETKKTKLAEAKKIITLARAALGVGNVLDIVKKIGKEYGIKELENLDSDFVGHDSVQTDIRRRFTNFEQKATDIVAVNNVFLNSRPIGNLIRKLGFHLGLTQAKVSKGLIRTTLAKWVVQKYIYPKLKYIDKGYMEDPTSFAIGYKLDKDGNKTYTGKGKNRREVYIIDVKEKENAENFLNKAYVNPKIRREGAERTDTVEGQIVAELTKLHNGIKNQYMAAFRRHFVGKKGEAEFQNFVDQGFFKFVEEGFYLHRMFSGKMKKYHKEMDMNELGFSKEIEERAYELAKGELTKDREPTINEIQAQMQRAKYVVANEFWKGYEFGSDSMYTPMELKNRTARIPSKVFITRENRFIETRETDFNFLMSHYMNRAALSIANIKYFPFLVRKIPSQIPNIALNKRTAMMADIWNGGRVNKILEQFPESYKYIIKKAIEYQTQMYRKDQTGLAAGYRKGFVGLNTVFAKPMLLMSAIPNFVYGFTMNAVTMWKMRNHLIMTARGFDFEARRRAKGQIGLTDHSLNSLDRSLKPTKKGYYLKRLMDATFNVFKFPTSEDMGRYSRVLEMVSSLPNMVDLLKLPSSEKTEVFIDKSGKRTIRKHVIPNPKSQEVIDYLKGPLVRLTDREIDLLKTYGLGEAEVSWDEQKRFLGKLVKLPKSLRDQRFREAPDGRSVHEKLNLQQELDDLHMKLIMMSHVTAHGTSSSLFLPFATLPSHAVGAAIEPHLLFKKIPTTVAYNAFYALKTSAKHNTWSGLRRTIGRLLYSAGGIATAAYFMKALKHAQGGGTLISDVDDDKKNQLLYTLHYSGLGGTFTDMLVAAFTPAPNSVGDIFSSTSVQVLGDVWQRGLGYIEGGLDFTQATKDIAKDILSPYSKWWNYQHKKGNPHYENYSKWNRLYHLYEHETNTDYIDKIFDDDKYYNKMLPSDWTAGIDYSKRSLRDAYYYDAPNNESYMKISNLISSHFKPGKNPEFFINYFTAVSQGNNDEVNKLLEFEYAMLKQKNPEIDTLITELGTSRDEDGHFKFKLLAALDEVFDDVAEYYIQDARKLPKIKGDIKRYEKIPADDYEEIFNQYDKIYDKIVAGTSEQVVDRISEMLDYIVHPVTLAQTSDISKQVSNRAHFTNWLFNASEGLYGKGKGNVLTNEFKFMMLQKDIELLLINDIFNVHLQNPKSDVFHNYFRQGVNIVPKWYEDERFNTPQMRKEYKLLKDVQKYQRSKNKKISMYNKRKNKKTTTSTLANLIDSVQTTV